MGCCIGRAFALELGRRRSAVICLDIRLEQAEATAAMVRARGVHAVAIAADVSNERQMAEVAAQAESLLGRPINLVINNAGWWRRARWAKPRWMSGAG